MKKNYALILIFCLSISSFGQYKEGIQKPNSKSLPQEIPIKRSVEESYSERELHRNTTEMHVPGVDNNFVQQKKEADISTISIKHEKYVKVNEKVPVSIIIKNLNREDLSSSTVNYQINDLPVQSFDIKPGRTTNRQGDAIIINESIELEKTGIYNLKVWLSDINRNTNVTKKSNIIESQLNVINSDFQKTIILEEFTAVWCGWCPYGAVVMEELLKKYENLIGLCAHFYDTMAIKETYELAEAFKTYLPMASLDRYKFDNQELIVLDMDSLELKIKERLKMAVPAEVDFTFTYNEDTREINIDASAEFALDMTEEFRFNCYIVEDNIKKEDSDSAYFQSNYLSGHPDFKGHPYFSKPELITDYNHRHVIREMLGGSWGKEGSIQPNVVADQTYTHRFTDTLSKDYNPEQVYLVVTVQEYNTDTTKREILNAKQLKLTPEKSLKLLDKDGVSIADNDTIEVTGLHSDSEIKLKLSVQNTANKTTTVNVKKTVLNSINGMSNTFCWAGYCFPDEINTSTATAQILPDSLNDDFVADIAPKGKTGIQKIKYTFFNVDNNDDAISAIVHYNVEKGNSTNLRNGRERLIKYGPNPISKNGVLNIDFSAMDDSPKLIKMYDNTSRLIFIKQAKDSFSRNIEINLAQYNLSTGTYYVLVNSNNNAEAFQIVVVK